MLDGQAQVSDLPTIPSGPQSARVVPVHAGIDTFNEADQVVSPPQSPSSLESTGHHIKLIADATNNLRRYCMSLVCRHTG